MVELCSMTPEDSAFVQDLLEDFAAKTGSEVAKDLLANYGTAINQIVKVRSIF